MGLGDFLKSINNKAAIIDHIDVQSDYVPYITNRSLSYFIDTIMYANEMNIYSNLPKNIQYLYYVNVVRRGKRFAKWQKPNHNKYLEVVKEYYDYSYEKSKSALKLLTDVECVELERRLDKGGRK